MILRSENSRFINIKVLFSINSIDINKIVVSNKFPFDKQDFKYFLDYKYAKS